MMLREDRKIFIFWSRGLSLTDEAKNRINYFVDQGYSILIWDSEGIDADVQRFLRDKGYKKITIYHIWWKPRNNIWWWSTFEVSIDSIAMRRSWIWGKGVYINKDIEMCEECTEALVIWDGKSWWSKRNIVHLEKREKRVEQICVPNGDIPSKQRSLFN